MQADFCFHNLLLIGIEGFNKSGFICTAVIYLPIKKDFTS